MSVTPDHRDHDELVIGRAAARDADPADARMAQEQLAACAACRALFADVAAIQQATNRTTLRVPPRPRSFRIDPAVLERGAIPTWRRWLSRLGSPRYDVVRPLAGAVAGIGLAVMVVGSLAGSASLPAAAPVRDLAASPGASQGVSEVYGAPGSTAVPAPAATAQSDRTTSFGPTTGGATGSEAPTGASAGGAAASGSPGTTAVKAPASTPTKAVDSGSPPTLAPTSPSASPTVPIWLVGAIVVLGGASLFLLQSVARRIAGR
jgi:hypothetical protein